MFLSKSKWWKKPNQPKSSVVPPKKSTKKSHVSKAWASQKERCVMNSGSGLGGQITGCPGTTWRKLCPSASRDPEQSNSGSYVSLKEFTRDWYAWHNSNLLIYTIRNWATRNRDLYLLANVFQPWRQTRCKTLIRIRRLLGEHGIKTKRTVIQLFNGIRLRQIFKKQINKRCIMILPKVL